MFGWYPRKSMCVRPPADFVSKWKVVAKRSKAGDTYTLEDGRKKECSYVQTVCTLFKVDFASSCSKGLNQLWLKFSSSNSKFSTQWNPNKSTSTSTKHCEASVGLFFSTTRKLKKNKYGPSGNCTLLLHSFVMKFWPESSFCWSVPPQPLLAIGRTANTSTCRFMSMGAQLPPCNWCLFVSLDLRLYVAPEGFEPSQLWHKLDPGWHLSSMTLVPRCHTCRFRPPIQQCHFW